MQFVDEVTVKVISGDGGNGMVAWRREKYEPLGGPAGGTGGRGGHVVLEASSDMSTLLDFRYRTEFKAKPGEKGGPKNRHGKDGEDLVIKVPLGTVVKDLEDDRIIADLNTNGARALVAEGGRGGRGNTELATPTHRAPYHCEPGEAGIERTLQLTLKLIADVGLIGLPNAGKSTLLSVLTAAHPKIADYPFSTLTPNLGVMKGPEGDGFVLADIPGLIEGASQGIGLGHQFLRHIERTRILVHLADINSESLEQDLKTICLELNLYDEHVARMPQIVFLNKADLILPEEAEEIAERIKKNQKEIFPHPEAISIILHGSCGSFEGITDLKNSMFELLSKNPKQEQIFQVLDDDRAYQHPDEGFVVSKKKGVFYVVGDRVERMLSVTNMREPESLRHFFYVLRAMGIIEALLQHDLQVGDEVVIGKCSFTYGDEMF
jgi:GTP-binding protein